MKEKKSKYGRRWSHSGVPLGGIGAGKIELCPNGRFSNCTTNNNWDVPICDGTARQKPVRNPEGIPGSFFAVHIKNFGTRILKTASFKGYNILSKDEIDYKGLFPRAFINYKITKDIDLSLEAFSPFFLNNSEKDHYKNSSLPTAIFLFKIKNKSTRKKEISIAFSWQNLVGQGGYVRGEINDTRKNLCRYKRTKKYHGLYFTSETEKVDLRVQGSYSLLTPIDKSVKFTYFAGWSPNEKEYDLWEFFSKDGTLPDKNYKGPNGAIAIKFKLNPGKEKSIPFVLSWYFPYLLASSDKKINYGHAYSNWFKDSWQVAEYVFENFQFLHEETKSWQQALMNSNLPNWLIIKLTNDLFPIFSNSWYTRDFRFTINEAPTDMGGCAGTIDQRAASHSIYAMCFPQLNKSELTLFAEQQIKANDPYRYANHWNCKTGCFDRKLDRRGAIRHDVGWDEIGSGSLGLDERSPCLHWPDTQTVFVLQCYGHYLWTGEKKFLDYIYPKIKDVLDFETRLDQNQDGIAELWGTGSNTYDGDIFPYFGASSFVASLHLAALKAAEKMARWKNDKKLAQTCQTRFRQIANTMEKKLWNKQNGYYICWLDETYRNWSRGKRPHPKKSDNCMIAQLAGQWFANLFNLGDILDRKRIETAITKISERNVRKVPYSPANEVTPDGKFTSSWPYYAETYYAANAIYENQPDAGLECLEKIYKTMHIVEASPWDAVLYYGGKDNTEPLWGNWYMTNPASWFSLLAIGGFAMNIPDGELLIAPNIPKKIGNGKSLKKLPIFMPQFWATINYRINPTSIKLDFAITRWHGKEPLKFNRLITKLPRGIESEKINIILEIDGKKLKITDFKLNPQLRTITIQRPFQLDARTKIGFRLSF